MSTALTEGNPHRLGTQHGFELRCIYLPANANSPLKFGHVSKLLKKSGAFIVQK